MKFPIPAPALPLLLLSLAVLEPVALPPDFGRVDVAGNLKFPQSMRIAPDGRIFLGNHAGDVIVVKDGKALATPFVHVKTWTGYRENMTGLALDPDFAGNGYLYLYHYADVDGAKRTRISRFSASKANPDVAEAGSEVVILDSIAMGVYVGGALLFGKDGMLYVASGMGGSQNPATLGGKVLRIDPKSYPRIIPPDNPFVGRPGARGEIWALGFREPFSGAVDPATGDLIINDVGESWADELDLIRKGANYGFEAGCEGACGKAGMENPWVELLLGAPHRYNCVTGSAFYHGNRYPSEYRGAYFFGDWGKQRVNVRKPDGSLMVFDSSQTSVIQFDVGPDGYLYMLKLAGETGTVQKLVYTGPSGIASDGTGGLRGHIGPQASTASRRSGEGLAFHAGLDPVLRVEVDVVDLQGRPVASLRSMGNGLPLVWKFRETAAPGVFHYSLRILPRRGNLLTQYGRILLTD